MISEMRTFKLLLLKLLSCFVLLAALLVVIAQADQSGFISIDCGSSESSYIDQYTGINYTSDDGFTDSGMNMRVPPSIYGRAYISARIFPEGKRNCYTLRPEKGKNNTYMIAAYFVYGNYDGKNQIPVFDLYIGEDYWNTVILPTVDGGRRYEIIHSPRTDYIHVCLHRTGATVPFISVLELRPLNNTLYNTQAGPLQLVERMDLGTLSGNTVVRYPYDVFDRPWNPFQIDKFVEHNIWKRLSTDVNVEKNDIQVPSAVMSTAVSPQNSSDSLYMSWWSFNSSKQLFLYLHFAEIAKLRSDEFREFEIYLNGDLWKKEFSPPYLKSYTMSSISPEPAQVKYELSINSTKNSTLPPIINAVEIYGVKNFTNSGTDDTDVAAMFGIKSYYGLVRNWQGDPCRSRAFTWEGVSCNYDHNSSRIVSLNLSSSGLNGSIAPHIANFTSIEILDLSNNNLSGGVPHFLAQLASLKILNLVGNNFSGPIPTELAEKSKHGLNFSIEGPPKNVNIDVGKRKNNIVVPAVASALVAFVVIFFVFITACIVKRRRKTVTRKKDVNLNKNGLALQNKNWQIPYSEVLKITNNFERVLGKGGFGTVYYGIMGNIEVAVKMLNPSSAQGQKEFQAEASLLMNVHHKNLTSLMGYCNEGANIGIIYEYMANGNLQQHLSELSWEQRLRIAIDAAQGLEYLHHGCKPPIVHRDVKPTNILLNGKFQAKLSDFGLSRAFADQSNTHISINTIAGSPGYMDPEYHSSFKLTEKSDVYSFGVILLEIITGRPVLDMNCENRHITSWVVPFLQNGDIGTIVDIRFKGNLNINAVWKVVELAMGCVSWHSTTRPTMNNVVIELKECLALEMSNLEIEPNSLTGALLESEQGPQVR